MVAVACASTKESTFQSRKTMHDPRFQVMTTDKGLHDFLFRTQVHILQWNPMCPPLRVCSTHLGRHANDQPYQGTSTIRSSKGFQVRQDPLHTHMDGTKCFPSHWVVVNCICIHVHPGLSLLFSGPRGDPISHAFERGFFPPFWRYEFQSNPRRFASYLRRNCCSTRALAPKEERHPRGEKARRTRVVGATCLP